MRLAGAERDAPQAIWLKRQVLSQAHGESDAHAVADLNEVVGGFAAAMGQPVRENMRLKVPENKRHR